MKTAGRRAVSSPQQVPPWLQEDIRQFQQAQQNLQVVLAQKQQLEMERIESERALEELAAAGDDQAVYKLAGMVMIGSSRQKMTEEIEERKALASTRAQVLAKQEERLKASIKEKEEKIRSMLQGGGQPPPGAGRPAPGGMQPPPPPPPPAAAPGG